MKTIKVVACTHNGKLNGHIVPRHLKNKGSADDMWDVEARLIRESDFRAMMKIVRLDAASQCRALGGDCGKCAPCRARKLLKEKR